MNLRPQGWFDNPGEALKQEGGREESANSSKRYELSRAVLADHNDSFLQALEHAEAVLSEKELQGKFSLSVLKLYLTEEEEAEFREELDRFTDRWEQRCDARKSITNRTVSLCSAFYPQEQLHSSHYRRKEEK